VLDFLRSWFFGRELKILVDLIAVRDFGIPLFLAAILTPVARFAALKIGWTYRPDPRKWKRKANPHPAPIAMGGGFAMLAGFAVPMVLKSNPQLSAIFLFALYAAVLGFYDDIKSPKPIYRLTIQTLLGLATVILIGWVQGLPVWLSIPITVFGIVGLMNSVNMMDNMDGVASGLMTLSMLGYAVLGWLTKNDLVTVLGLTIAGAALGFWLYNKPPALVFMGDTGSLMLGYLLAVVGTVATWGEYPNLFARLVAPFLLSIVFITDTTFVVLWRKTHGLPVTQGDRNHISHRLAVLFGHSEWKANLALYLVQLLANAAAILVAISPIHITVIATLSVFAFLSLLSWRLWQVEVG